MPQWKKMHRWEMEIAESEPMLGDVLEKIEAVERNSDELGDDKMMKVCIRRDRDIIREMACMNFMLIVCVRAREREIGGRGNEKRGGSWR